MQDAESLPPRVVDTRMQPRQRALQSGKITYRDGTVVLDCTIRDLSADGARVTVSRNEIVPTHLILIFPRGQIAYEAQVTWIKAPHYGLKFLGAHPLQHDLPANLDYLKRLAAQP